MTPENLVTAHVAEPDTPQAKAAVAFEREAALREKAARQAAKTKKEAEAPKMVKLRVTEFGDGKISTGEHIAGIGEVHYEADEIFECPEGAAALHRQRGWVELKK